ncbi:MAG: hypothetical protein AB7N80_07520 [Bdellovibrionales bacterium]
MMRLMAVAMLLGLANVSCQARFSSVGKDLPNAPQAPVIKPDPEWQGGYVNVDCLFNDQHTSFSMGRIGMLDQDGLEFLGSSYHWVKFADEGWMMVWINFPGHDSNARPIVQPTEVQVEYYIFLRPDWRAPENFYEIRRSRRFNFAKDQSTLVQWRFTEFKLECRVQPAL